MTVLLTHGYFLSEDPREQQIMRPYAPLGLLYIAAYLDEHGIDNAVFDTTFSTRVALFGYLEEHQPAIVGIYVNLMTKVQVLNVVAHIKERHPNTQVILGGPEVTYHAEAFLRHGADWIVIGEGEETMLELVNHIRSRPNPKNDHAAANISGLAFLKGENFIQTAERAQRKELDNLPFPARHKIDLPLYLNAWRTRHGKSAISVSTMRGCPYTCKWCSRAVYGLSYRRRSAEQVVEELSAIRQDYHPDYIWFVDDVFTISHKWLNEFHRTLQRRNIRIQYECITRADRLNEEVMGLLKATGCFRVWIGAESGSQKIIDLMDRRVDIQQVKDMIQLARRYQIEAGTFIMLGYPGETEADILETVSHLKASNPDHFTITVAYPIKGTDFYQDVEALQNTKLDWSTSNDRQIDFKRTYRRRYYDFAVSHVVNEVKYYQRSRGGRSQISATPFKIKSAVARVGMWLHRIKP